MLLTLIINGDITSYEVETYEFSHSKYEGQEVTLIFNGIKYADNLPEQTTQEKIYVAEGVNKPSPKGYAEETLRVDQPIGDNPMFVNMLATAREKNQIIVVDVLVNDSVKLIEINTDPFTEVDIDLAIQKLAEKEKLLIPSGLIVIKSPPTIKQCYEPEGGESASRQYIISESVCEGVLVATPESKKVADK